MVRSGGYNCLFNLFLRTNDQLGKTYKIDGFDYQSGIRGRPNIVNALYDPKSGLQEIQILVFCIQLFISYAQVIIHLFSFNFHVWRYIFLFQKLFRYNHATYSKAINKKNETSICRNTLIRQCLEREIYDRLENKKNQKRRIKKIKYIRQFLYYFYFP